MTNNQLQAIVERIEKLEDERSILAEDIKDIYLEAKSSGYDPKVIKKLVALRKKDPSKLAEEEALLDTYKAALGMLADTPLGRAAMEREQRDSL